MKNKEKNFNTVEFFRKVKEKIAQETKDMSFDEFKKYIEARRLKTAKWKSQYHNISYKIFDSKQVKQSFHLAFTFWFGGLWISPKCPYTSCQISIQSTEQMEWIDKD